MHQNAKPIWDILRSNGCTEAGAAGVLGNMDAESGLVPCRMQGDFTIGHPKSIAYAAEVDSGRKSGEEFARDTINGGGWGLCQWTFWSRKLELYKFCKSMGKSIGDLTAQVLFFIKECREQYGAVWRTITTTDSVSEASDAVLLQYERPANMHAKTVVRSNIAQMYFGLLTGEQPPLVVEEKVKDSFWPPRMIEYGMSGADVKVAQAVLEARGYEVKKDTLGSFGYYTKAETKKFQSDNRLDDDGVIGSLTWAALLDRR